MKASEAVEHALTSTKEIVHWYLSDLDDADLLVRPVPSANHIAWQLGHLIVTEQAMGRESLQATYAALPAGFAEQHDAKNAQAESTKGFQTKAVYLDLFDKARDATLAAVGRLSDADLSRPTSGGMAKFAPTLGALAILLANHTLMHAGQFTVARRKLGKPVLF
jgi:hypothetical protein